MTGKHESKKPWLKSYNIGFWQRNFPLYVYFILLNKKREIWFYLTLWDT